MIMPRTILYQFVLGVFILCLGINLSSCAGVKPVTRWNPVSQKTFAQAGIEYQMVTLDSATVVCGVADIQGPHLYLDFELTNLTNQPLLMDPAAVYYTFRQRDKIIDIPAYNPETEILNGDIQINRNTASEKNLVAAGVTLFVIGTAVAIASDVSATTAPDQSSYNRDVAINAAGNLTMAVGHGMINSSMTKGYQNFTTTQKRQMWTNIVMRKTHALPYESIRGTIVLPVYPQESMIKLVIPIGNKQFEFNFDQKQYKKINQDRPATIHDRQGF